MKRGLLASVMALALTFGAAAYAQDTPPAKETSVEPAKESVSMPANEPSANLPLRPSKALNLASEPASTPLTYKVLFAAAVIAAGVIFWKKKKQPSGDKPAKDTSVRVLGKTPMGLRGELALVEVGGMRLLVGITSSSMQTLAVLPEGEAIGETETAHEVTSKTIAKAIPSGLGIADRARALLSSRDFGPPVPSRVAPAAFAASRYADDDKEFEKEEPRREAKETIRESREIREGKNKKSRPRDNQLEGQARGLALALGNAAGTRR
ncbi:hypothetical protein AKJ09_01381 [Labilithrix luteola]|uniref:Flagellar protein n=1 Tax=Labilithrix luteola TaxID=1391654 RepID=A0A0K1PMI2_9BACT|nr:flagellar biosynthetic protein FliO [Labilithrix luteola]AKU94717.1 hypothetical protein AKJ09_01381 [Labilithrix luteola]